MEDKLRIIYFLTLYQVTPNFEILIAMSLKLENVLVIKMKIRNIEELLEKRL